MVSLINFNLYSIGLVAAIKAKNAEMCLHFAKQLIMSQYYNQRAMALVSQFAKMLMTINVNRKGYNRKLHLVITKALYQHGDSLPLRQLASQVLTNLSHYLAALNQQLYIFSNDSSRPSTLLYMGMLSILIGLQEKRNSHDITNVYLFQGMSYFHAYSIKTNHSDYALYNLAKAYHLIGLYGDATRYYNKVLSYPNGSKLIENAAFNLSLIYSKTSPLLAREVTMKYLSV